MIRIHAENGTCKTPGRCAGNLARAGRLMLCLVLALGASFSARGDEFQKAITKGNFNRVVALLKDHPDLLDKKNSLGLTPLMVAVSHNQLEIAKLLLANGADVNARDVYMHTPLILAMWVYNHDQMVRLLLTKGADVNLEDKWNMTALAYAVRQGQLNDAKILIANDANINVVAGASPLYWAVMGFHTEMVELLLANGADVNYKFSGFAALHYASNPKIEALLKKYGGHE